MKLEDYAEVWLVQFVADRPPGERPTPVGLVAREHRTGRVLRLEQGSLGVEPPFPLGPDALYVAYDAPAALGCHLALGWPMPAKVLDLHAEFRCLASGLLPPGDYDLQAALAHTRQEGEGVDGLAALLSVLGPDLDLPNALLRGRYAAAVARMEWVGVPLDVATLDRLNRNWGRFQSLLIEEVDRDYGVYVNGQFNARRWAAWVNRQHIPWPRTGPGRLDLTRDTFTEMAGAYPEVRAMHELRATITLLRPANLPVGRDGRNRCPLRPYAAKTGRNAPSTTKFIFGPATWLRGLIKPEEGTALAYLDFEQQEFGIAAALSGDPAMRQAYLSGDPYLAFAKQAGAAPPDATKASHREVRERLKTCALGVQYGMEATGLARRLGIPVARARDLVQLHRRTYPRYWDWSRLVGRTAKKDGGLQAAYGWRLNVGTDANQRSVRNFPLQANGAEMLRLACCLLDEAGVRVCAPVHDALLVEAPAGDIDQVAARTQQAMVRASGWVLTGFPLRTEVKVVRHPDRYMDDRGRAMWTMVMGLLDGERRFRAA